MQKGFLKYIFLFLAIAIVSCAKRGTITGGLKDTIAPKIIGSVPKNFATGFNGKEIKISFDEYVKLKDINKQLIISPPMKSQPEILPYTASKFITIRIKDTLLPNTTYSFNFGKSIQDNNEGNPYQQFKYVFSTGSYIDSLVLGGKVKDALERKVDNYVSLMLYEVNEKYNDSIIFKEVPRYVTNTLDSLKLVKFENLKQGKYRLIALKDANGNNKYDPKTDKIGFQKDFVTIPNDTLYELELFKEEQPFKALNVSQASGNRFTMGYQGNPKDVKIAIKKGAEEIPFVVSKLPKKDSLQVYFQAIKGDSLSIDVSKNKFKKMFSLKIKEQKKDSVSFTCDGVGTLNFRDTIALNSNVALTKWDNSKIKLINKDSAEVKFITRYDAFNQKLVLDFKKEPLEKYVLKFLPGAVTNYNEKVNDTLLYQFSTNNYSEYGNLRVTLEHVKRFPVIVQLTNDKGDVLATGYSDKSLNITFDLIEPKKYTLRLIYDDNNDKMWTPGNFLEQRQSEEVIYFPKEIDVRANWDVEQPFDASAE
ncbi:Ig-like domain-containing protein [Flavobacterium sp. SUN052]|uniref:Ig-like domain-containing protein n=1 Tax=Flavobacterium sp. SUN052 TaxID=3002441 RepID=UPI00237D36F0|nr:Ig-like domain-containing protein [Flavobacterium sp. SUN052]MEC4004220.1 Ig-like domain-containing protein [Flavobacterium sp. SUN052]